MDEGMLDSGRVLGVGIDLAFILLAYCRPLAIGLYTRFQSLLILHIV